jgi:hypothetical protein
LDKIPKPPPEKPLSQYADTKNTAAKEALKETNFRAPSASTKATKVLTETYKAEKPASTESAAASDTKELSGKGSEKMDTVTSSKAAAEMPASASQSGRLLITYAYSESPNARSNIEFFIKHGLHGSADFVFILNGETDIDKIIPADKPNVRYVSRPNTCFDLGAHSEVLLDKDLYKKYTRFILMNASIRGPYLPYWSASCWSDLYLQKVTEDTKVCLNTPRYLWSPCILYSMKGISASTFSFYTHTLTFYDFSSSA